MFYDPGPHKKPLNSFVRKPKKNMKLLYPSDQISIKQFQYLPPEKAAIARRKKPSDSWKSLACDGLCRLYWN